MSNDDGVVEVLETELLEPLAERAERDQRRRLETLIEAGLSPPLALDYYMVEDGDYTATEWANVRDVSPQAVWENVDRAKDMLNES